jgi:phosphoglycerol transferase MdoB-like AlkP superfamily enzyme
LKDIITLSPRLKAFLKLLITIFAALQALRLIFFLIFSSKAGDATTAELAQAALLGVRFDLRIALLLTLPILLLTLFTRLKWQTSGFARRTWSLFYTAILGFVLLVHMVDIGYYEYLESRINFRVFEFFKNPLISAAMVYETYNLWLWVPVFLAVTYMIVWSLEKSVFTNSPTSYNPNTSRRTKTLQAAVLTPLILVGIYGQLGQYPLRWSDAFFTQNMFVANLAMNPLQYIFDTAQNSKRDYDTNVVREHYEVMADYLGLSAKERLPEKLSFVRSVPQNPIWPTKPNIVYIVMESMVAYKTSLFGNRPEASPHLEELAQKGWLFENFYTPTEGTARSMFCILTGVPDINAKSTSSRNPLIINQHTLINGLKDHDKMYFIGGSAAWGNIRGVYMNNVEKLKMYEDKDLEGPKTDVWGLSDLDLFRASAKVLQERAQSTKKPFFALIQTASYHRPYTIPDDNAGFEKLELSPQELKKHGFSSNEEYNSFRFSDHSLGEFFKLVKNEPYFANTVFIIHGDHGLPHHEAGHLTPGYKHFGLNRFHTPLVFYSPLIQKPERFPQMMSEPDVWPTILGLTGYKFATQTLGRNVLALTPKQKQYVFSYVYYSDPLQIMLYDQEFIAYGTENKVESLHRYQDPEYLQDLKEKYPDKFKEMANLLQGIFESSKFMLHHNSRLTE